ncbi:YkvA family protein [Cognatilysobacter tabacisoli]|uniref:DUF1232 domain-containing protein n=1 Tax=Cognatilysobacter tabacisoli TaxID=2315424 RepID=UPI000E6B0C78|nr:DUF1232 domain-containing protein [Lysobacter tabacisoli]
MNAQLAPAYPLPTVLQMPAQPGPHRRHTVNGFVLQAQAVDRFNRLLDQLGRPTTLDSDQLSAAARELCGQGIGAAAPRCIRQRLLRLAVLDRMAADRDWTPANDAIALTRRVVGYARDRNDLIPDWVPRVGRLDDAIVVDAAWPRLADEAGDYADFCRIRAIEAHLSGRDVHGYRFQRADWIEARAAEVALQQHRAAVRQFSYVPSAPARFAIH